MRILPPQFLKTPRPTPALLQSLSFALSPSSPLGRFFANARHTCVFPQENPPPSPPCLAPYPLLMSPLPHEVTSPRSSWRIRSGRPPAGFEISYPFLQTDRAGTVINRDFLVILEISRSVHARTGEARQERQREFLSASRAHVRAPRSPRRPFGFRSTQ